MKPFDLEKARRGEAIVYFSKYCTHTSPPLHFVGMTKNGCVVIENSNGSLQIYEQQDIFMAPSKRTVWVNLLLKKNGTEMIYHYDCKEDADKESIVWEKSKVVRIGNKVWPLEIEE